MTNKLVVLLGIHGSGKSTLGAALPDDRFKFFPEIGTTLRLQVKEAVTDSQELFDHQVMSQEIARDEEVLNEQRIPVVETWHLGNLAFAMARGSHRTIASYRTVLARQLSRFEVQVVKLNLSDRDFLVRLTERNVAPMSALRFYRLVERHQNDIMTEFLGAEQPALIFGRPWTPMEAAGLLSRQLG